MTTFEVISLNYPTLLLLSAYTAGTFILIWKIIKGEIL